MRVPLRLALAPPPATFLMLRGVTRVLRRPQRRALTALGSRRISSDARAPLYTNVDGGRLDDGRYAAFKTEVRAMLGEDRVVDDPVRTFAFGTDASHYRLVPQAVVRVYSEEEVVQVRV